MITQLTLLRNILTKSFLIGFLFMLVSFILYLPLQGFIPAVWVPMLGISEEIIPTLIISFYTLFKVAIFILFLIPALAIHWTIKVMEKEQTT
jgi:hypothetical protein